MSNLNRITLIGNVGADPEYVAFESGAMLTKFPIAVGRYDKRKEQDVTDWFDVETFSKLGEYVKKGMKVCVDGKMVTTLWEKDDKKIKFYTVSANTIEILTPKKDREEQGQEQQEQEDLGCNADYPEDYPENSGYPQIPIDEDIDDEEISF